MRVAIVGSRTFNNQDFLDWAIQDSELDITEVVCGEAPGADTVGRLWAEENGIPVVSFPAEWDNLEAPGAVIRTTRYGKPYNARAGHDRNTRMAEYCDVVLAFWDGKSPGTKHMLSQAKKMRKPVCLYHTDQGGNK